MAEARAGRRFGVDVGGTFTDVVAYDERSGALTSLKVPTTPQDQAEGVLAGIAGLLDGGDGIAGVVHGTTAVTNAILEERAAPVTLVTTPASATPSKSRGYPAR